MCYHMRDCLIYQHYDNYFKICQRHYTYLLDLKFIYSSMYTHHLIHIDSVFREAKCTVCNEIMIIAKDVINCPSCLKQFQHISAEKSLYKNTFRLRMEITNSQHASQQHEFARCIALCDELMTRDSFLFFCDH